MTTGCPGIPVRNLWAIPCLAWEVQHMERMLNANLSQALRNSITFSKNLQLCDNGRSHCFSRF